MNIVEPIRHKKDLDKLKTYLKQQSIRNYLLLVIGINTGLRISDILTLHVKDILTKEYITIKEEKTSKTRHVYFNDNIKQAIKLLNPARCCVSNNDYLFVNNRKDKGHINRQQAYKILNDACKAVNINYRIGTHTLRKTFAYWHYKQYNDIALLQTILNHSSQAITLKYIGVTDELIYRSIDRLVI